jgi:1,4-alpha-glucan branching enzyme
VVGESAEDSRSGLLASGDEGGIGMSELPVGPVVHGPSLLSDYDVYLFREGKHFRLYDVLGAHPATFDEEGVHFAVWAPNAAAVSVVADFNGWDDRAHPLAPRWEGSGIWEGFVPGAGVGAHYKYAIRTTDGRHLFKADPFALFGECPPKSASIVWTTDFDWTDGDWMRDRPARNGLASPVSIYEVHLGSWQRVPEEGNRSLTYREMAERLVSHLDALGFTHVELLPVMEHPFYGSWGYQTLSYFAPTARYGDPQGLMALIDALHRAGIGVILDWVPSHFPTDGHGLMAFDGTCLYEHANPREGYHPDWKSAIFNYGRNEVRSFLGSSGAFWLDRYHADGLRVDAVASMLYRDYSRRAGEWVPNRYGGRENLEAIEFLRATNTELYGRFPGIQIAAEESTAWPMVSRPTWLGGLGFGLKWNMGWMHDVLAHFARDPIHRKWHGGELTFGMWYAYTENFLLPLSHDEVVHGKGSLWRKQWGDDRQKASGLRLLYGWMFAHPGKKLLFMGGEFGQEREWNHDASLDWDLLHGDPEGGLHGGILRWTRDLNAFYRSRPELFECDYERRGFEWVDCTDTEGGILSCLRRDGRGRALLCVGNFTPIPRSGYRIGVPEGGFWREALNSDAACYGGAGEGNLGGREADPIPWHGRSHSLNLHLPGLSFLFFLAPEREEAPSEPPAPGPLGGAGEGRAPDEGEGGASGAADASAPDPAGAGERAAPGGR